MDQQSHSGDKEQVNARQRVKQIGEISAKCSHLNPGKKEILNPSDAFGIWLRGEQLGEESKKSQYR